MWRSVTLSALPRKSPKICSLFFADAVAAMNASQGPCTRVLDDNKEKLLCYPAAVKTTMRKWRVATIVHET